MSTALAVASRYNERDIPSGGFLARFAPRSSQRMWRDNGVENPGAMIQIEADQMIARLLESSSLPTAQSLAYALFHLVAQGVSLAPFNQECAIIPFAGKATPVLMRKGLERLAYEHWPIRLIDPKLVLEGDDFEYRGAAAEPKYRAGNKHALIAKALPAIMGGQILEGFVTVTQRDTNGDFCTVGHLDRPGFAEKIRANRNARSPKADSAWAKHPIEMLKKTLVKYTLTKVMRPQGEFMFAMMLDSYATAHKADEGRKHLIGAATSLLGAGVDDVDQMAEMTEGAEADGESAQPRIKTGFIEAEVQGG